MYAIIGLGNPGKKYELTRHNVGYMAIDQLAKAHQISVEKLKHQALVGQGRINGEKVILVKPITYMNLSGNAVREVIDYYKIPIENTMIIYDDIDIPLGKLRIRKEGGSGTHNGMKSIIASLGSKRFPRIRIGIAPENSSHASLADYVLGSFTQKEWICLSEPLESTVKVVETMIEKGLDNAMNHYNR